MRATGWSWPVLASTPQAVLDYYFLIASKVDLVQNATPIPRPN